MFFTPGRIIGLIVFVLVLLVITVLLKRLESRLNGRFEVASEERAPLPRTQTAPRPLSKRSHGRPRGAR